MDRSYHYLIKGEKLELLPQKCIYWPLHHSLLVADLHLGKAGHFRKAGIPIPVGVHQHDLGQLAELIGQKRIEKVIVLGDLFHSQTNNEMQLLMNFVSKLPNISFELVAGNHDAYAMAQLEEVFKIHKNELLMPPFIFSHEPMEPQEMPVNTYNLSGHIHPKVVLKGIGRQRLRLSCFFFGKQYGILPAYGAFTGGAEIRPKPGDDIFVLTGRGVVPFLSKVGSPGS